LLNQLILNQTRVVNLKIGTGQCDGFTGLDFKVDIHQLIILPVHKPVSLMKYADLMEKKLVQWFYQQADNISMLMRDALLGKNADTISRFDH
jgi:hypothetical protein